MTDSASQAYMWQQVETPSYNKKAAFSPVHAVLCIWKFFMAAWAWLLQWNDFFCWIPPQFSGSFYRRFTTAFAIPHSLRRRKTSISFLPALHALHTPTFFLYPSLLSVPAPHPLLHFPNFQTSTFPGTGILGHAACLSFPNPPFFLQKEKGKRATP